MTFTQAGVQLFGQKLEMEKHFFFLQNFKIVPITFCQVWKSIDIL